VERPIGTLSAGTGWYKIAVHGIVKYVGSVRIGECGTVKSATNAPTAYLCPVSIAAMMKVSKNSEGGFPSGQLETEGRAGRSERVLSPQPPGG
jgi:hypothetical protein